jgi:hypothetical protein
MQPTPRTCGYRIFPVLIELPAGSPGLCGSRAADRCFAVTQRGLIIFLVEVLPPSHAVSCYQYRAVSCYQYRKATTGPYIEDEEPP